ncbi:MAG: AmmeMemoRadiSam system protein A [Pseudomonadales bacterium]
MRCAEFDNQERELLLRIARASIEQGFARTQALSEQELVAADMMRPGLYRQRASFITLTRDGELRGCTGSLEACRTVAADVARSAYRSAFSDYRFPSLQPRELGELRIEIAVLSPQMEIEVDTEQELIEMLQPLEDGLVIDDGPHRATFLPKVWESIPDARQFLSELKRKAGLPGDYWSPDIRVYRYHTESFG